MAVISLSYDRHAQELTIVPDTLDEEITGTTQEINHETSLILVRIYSDEAMTDYPEDDFYMFKIGGAI